MGRETIEKKVGKRGGGEFAPPKNISTPPEGGGGGGGGTGGVGERKEIEGREVVGLMAKYRGERGVAGGRQGLDGAGLGQGRQLHAGPRRAPAFQARRSLGGNAKDRGKRRRRHAGRDRFLWERSFADHPGRE